MYSDDEMGKFFWVGIINGKNDRDGEGWKTLL